MFKQIALKVLTYTRVTGKSFSIAWKNGSTHREWTEYHNALVDAFQDPNVTPKLYRQYARYVLAAQELKTTPILKK